LTEEGTLRLAALSDWISQAISPSLPRAVFRNKHLELSLIALALQTRKHEHFG
jgi:hypothetical protein